MKPNVTRVGLYMSDTMKEEFRNMADEMGTNMSSVITMVLKQYLDQQKALKMTSLQGGLQVMMDELMKLQAETPKEKG